MWLGGAAAVAVSGLPPRMWRCRRTRRMRPCGPPGLRRRRQAYVRVTWDCHGPGARPCGRSHERRGRGSEMDGLHYARQSPRMVYARALWVGQCKPAPLMGCIEAVPHAPGSWRRSPPCLWLPIVGRAAKQCRRAPFFPPLSRGVCEVFFRAPVVLSCGLGGWGGTGCLQRLVAQPLPPQPDGCPRRPPCG